MKIKKMVLVAVFLLAIIQLSALPCWDMYKGCKDGGGSQAYCDGVWLGCMYARYK